MRIRKRKTEENDVMTTQLVPFIFYLLCKIPLLPFINIEPNYTSHIIFGLRFKPTITCNNLITYHCVKIFLIKYGGLARQRQNDGNFILS